jgi:hypothetical protein
MTGPGAVIFWLGVIVTGAAIGWALVRLIGWCVDNWPGDLDCNDYCGSPRGDE